MNRGTSANLATAASSPVDDMSRMRLKASVAKLKPSHSYTNLDKSAKLVELLSFAEARVCRRSGSAQPGMRVSRDHRNGFSTAMPKYSWPAFKSPDQIRPQPPRSAAATIMPS